MAAVASTSASAIVDLVAIAPKPKLVLAPDAVVAPVPPFAIAISVALHVPAVMVPTVAKLANEVNVVFEVAVILPAVVAVVALPVKGPLKPAAVIVPLVFTVVTFVLPN